MCTYVYGMCMNDPNSGERVHTWGCFRQYSMRGARWYRWYVERTTEFTWVYGSSRNFVFDNEIKTALIPFGRENKEAYSLVYYDNTCDAYGVSAAEEVAEQDSSYM